jgi:cell division protein FtsW
VNHGDRWLLGLPLALTGFGLIMVYSASSMLGIERFHDPNHYLFQQVFRVVMGLGVMLACTRVNLRRLEVLGPWLLGSSMLLLLVVSVAGHISNGAARWIRMGTVTFQPTDLARLATVVFMAWWLKRRPPESLGLVRGVLPPLGIAVVMAGLILAQPNLSSAALLGFTCFLMVFLAGARLVHLAVPVAAGGLAVMGALLTHPYQMERVKTFAGFLFGGDVNELGSGYQLTQSLIAIGSGGWFGRGLGQGLQKNLYLPEPHTDFIFSVLAEELGFLGVTFLLVLFALLLWRGLRATARARDDFAHLLAGGLTFQIGLYAAVNLAVATGLAPTTGLPLPFVSYGGSALLANLAAAGLLYRVSSVTHVRESVERSRWSREGA